MLDAVASFFLRLVESARLADLLDVLLVAAFLYALLTWVRRDTRPGTTWRLAFVLVAFAAVYLLAQAFSMYLVGGLLRALFVAFLVAAVVLFQSEIRRMIDRIGAFSFRRSSPSSGRGEHTLDLITEAAGHLAETHTGALMAVRGRDAWEGVVQGGIALDGRLSLALLESVFHEDTDGHDGAVLIEEDRATSFGAHLPLASELPKASRAGGTRHAAALGLSEQSDAFVIVVSEERGSVSVAEQGHLEETNLGELRDRLGHFWRTHYDDSATRERWWGRKSVQTACLALLMASLFWLSFAYDPGSTQRTLDVPVAFRNVGPRWLVGEPNPPEVSLSLSGSQRAFDLLDESSLSVSFPRSELEEGINELLVTNQRLDLPSGLRLEEARPQVVRVEAQPLQTVRLPVRVQSSSAGSVPDSLRLYASPDSADLLVPRNAETPPDEIVTQAVSLDSLRRAGTLQADLLPPSNTRLPEDGARRVEVRLAAADSVAARP